MGDISPLALHAAATSVMCFAWSRIGTLPYDEMISKQKGGQLQFLTIQALRMLLMVALPLAFVVTAIYWSLYIFCPTLILRPENDEPTPPGVAPKLIRPPLHVDLAMHVAPFISLLTDFLLFEHKFSHEHLNNFGPVALLFYGISYACWVEYCAFHNGVFPYPFLTLNPFRGRAVVYTCVTVLATLDREVSLH
ncbi:FAR-17a/AIG1-like protein-domain-containing protein [Scleroderma yunnanense]